MKQKSTKNELLSKAALLRDNTNRIAALPKGNSHWRWNLKPNVLTLHKRIHRKYGSAKSYMCTSETCNNKALDWAFVGIGEYTDKREDYTTLCRSCHIKLDKHHTKRNVECYKRNRLPNGRFCK